MRLDVTKVLPFRSDFFVAVYSSHLLEHLYQEQALNLLRECHRVLRPGAVCRAVVPDLEFLVKRYLDDKEAFQGDAATRFMEAMLVHDKRPSRGLRGIYYRATAFHQHKWMYDAASLQELFEAAGFKCVRNARCLDSAISRIAEVEDPQRILHGQGIVVEGVKE